MQGTRPGVIMHHVSRIAIQLPAFFSLLSLGRNGMVSMPGIVIKHTIMKNVRYPTACWRAPLLKPGSIMPSAIIPVEIA